MKNLRPVSISAVLLFLFQASRKCVPKCKSVVSKIFNHLVLMSQVFKPVPMSPPPLKKQRGNHTVALLVPWISFGDSLREDFYVFIYIYPFRSLILTYILNIYWMDKFVNRNVIHSLGSIMSLRVLISKFLKKLLLQMLSYFFYHNF